jgi:lysophospholipase L1-like esterase
MKRFTIGLAAFFVFVFGFEYSNVFGQNSYKPALQSAFISNEYVLSWPRLSYPALYQIQVLNYPPANETGNLPPRHTIATYYTWDNQFTIEKDFPFRTYWRVSAQGLFRRPLGNYSDPLKLASALDIASEDFSRIKPQITSYFSDTNPASARPMLTWKVVPGAVYYEVEFLSGAPENPNGIDPSQYRITMSREVFTNGFNPDLTALNVNTLYWRVRALNYDGNPIGVFSDAARLTIDRNIHVMPRPLITAEFNSNGTPTPLYPAYSWIPIFGAISYEVEVTNQLPEPSDSASPSRFRIWSKQVPGFDCYDEEPRNTPGTYYWRVRGLNAAGNPVGIWSQAGKFVVPRKQSNYSATFGDSITHGGGAVSYSPADWEYSYQTYLHFPTINLGKSGDTSEAMLARFDRDVLPYNPNYLIILGGTNSLRGGVPAVDVIRDLTAIRNKCQQHGIRPIFLTLPPINPANIEKVFNEETAPNWQAEFDAVNDFIKQQRYYIDIEPFFSDANGELPDRLAIDGLHPDIPGKKLMAGIINRQWARVTR